MIKYLSNWNIIRVLRLLLGLFVIVQGIMDKQWMLIGLGALFALIPLMNMGCSSTAGCRNTNT
ncbi:TPA: hypothetical protein ACG0AP_003869 [Elizabethkingia anophelis]|uniref:hypothetical protein n=1 Tax=Elizabethkingia anophelis TaxID=1117645 RepID=UPI00373377AE